MEQLEKVRKGLECCVLRDPDDHLRCGECPYNPHAISNESCANGLKFNALALINAQQERIKKLDAAQKWISVKDRLPRSMANKVLVYVQHEDLVGYIGFGHYERFHGEEMWYDLERGEQFAKNGYTVTYWMPLPEPPKEEECEHEHKTVTLPFGLVMDILAVLRFKALLARSDGSDDKL